MRRREAYYDNRQYRLVRDCEKPHQFGLRHKPISGDISNQLLVDFLRKEFVRLNFHTGVISKAKSRSKPSRKDRGLSPQADVIAYRGSPSYSAYRYAVVPTKKVLFAIEVKKWISPKSLSKNRRGLNGQLLKLRRFTEKPVLLVGFRHYGDAQWIRSQSKADETFLFSGGRPRGYPEKIKEFKKRVLHSGELLRFCNWIKQHA